MPLPCYECRAFAWILLLWLCLLVAGTFAKRQGSKWKKTGKFHSLPKDIDYDQDYVSLGCWKTGKKLNQFEDLEGFHEELDGLFWQRLDTIKKCAAVTKYKRYALFALTNYGECLGRRHMTKSYRKLGRSEKCDKGEGGLGAMNVYKLTGKSFQDSDDFEDDIILTKSQKALIDNPRSALYHDDMDLQTSAAMVLWPERTIPYHVPPYLAKTKVAKQFLAGIQQWQKKTCVKFVRKGNHRDWVEVFRERNPKSRRCASAIGRIGRYQPIRIGDLCPAGSIIHEWGHTLGLWHEQSREDRDKFVKINWENILPGKTDQFKKYRHFAANTLSVKYDYMSIMHYGKDYFSKLTPDQTGYLTTIETLDKKYRDKIGQRRIVTKADAEKVNLLYGCAENFQSIRNINLYVDLPGFKNPCILTGDTFRPDLLISTSNDNLYILELTVGFEPNLKNNADHFPYMWQTKQWSHCSAKCGTGTRKREIYCAKSDLKRVDKKRCSKSIRPRDKLACYGSKCANCPPGWHKLRKACYKVQDKKLSWLEARKLCLANGSDLLTLKTKLEEANIRSYLKSKNKHLSYYWLGAYYRSGDGDFYWVDESPVKYDNWKSGEPRWNVDCALLIHRDKWGTDNCLVERKYICKREIV